MPERKRFFLLMSSLTTVDVSFVCIYQKCALRFELHLRRPNVDVIDESSGDIPVAWIWFFSDPLPVEFPI